MDIISRKIASLLQENLYPSIISSKEDICFATPYQENQNYQVGIMLYDISSSEFINNTMIRTKTTLHYPSKHIDIFYIIYMNMESKFGGDNILAKQQVLSRMLQIFYDTPYLYVEDDKMQVSLENIPLERKIQLWQSFSKPLQACIYLKVSPVSIRSTNITKAHYVSEIDIKYVRKER